MKKIALILICCLVLIGCKNKDNNDNKFYRQYKEYENKIDNHNEFLNATNEFKIWQKYLKEVVDGKESSEHTKLKIKNIGMMLLLTHRQ